MTKQRILLICLVGILMFSVLLGGKFIYQKKWVDVSMLSESQQIQGVISAKVETNRGLKEMVVVTDNLTNLRQANQKLIKIVDNVPIRFIDRKNETLEKLFEEMQFAFQEGIARGNFTEMAQKVRTQAEEAGVQLELEMDNEAIYVVMNQGDAQLIEVIERNGQERFLPTEKE